MSTGLIWGQGQEGTFSVGQGEEVPWKCCLFSNLCPNPYTDEKQPREVKGLSKDSVRLFLHGSYHPFPSLSLPSQGHRCIHCRYCGHFRKDSRLYSYRRAGQSPKPYNLLPHPKGRQSVLA